jgi:hypothetical protein
MTKIKLTPINKIGEKICCKSQLHLNRDTCDFVLENGELFSWNGNGWSKSDCEYEIVSEISFQEL